MSPHMPITAALFRCNECHAVQAVEIDLARRDGRVIRPGYPCGVCGGIIWTRIKDVV